jgi:hypothetical protein
MRSTFENEIYGASHVNVISLEASYEIIFFKSPYDAPERRI